MEVLVLANLLLFFTFYNTQVSGSILRITQIHFTIIFSKLADRLLHVTKFLTLVYFLQFI